MNFLAPLFLAGVAAVALPFVFHLIRRSSKEHIPFSSLIFLQPTPPRMTRRSRLEHLLLLLLRCLVILLLALGFARPYFERPMTAPQTPETGRKIIVLLDTSASMRREGVWPAAAAKAAAALRATSPGDQVAVFTFDRQARSFVSFDQWAAMNENERIPVTVKRISEMKPGWGATHLGLALTTAAEAFTGADKQRPEPRSRRIILITDLQEGSRLDGLQGYDWPRGLDVQIEPVAPARPTNAGLQWVADTSDAGPAEAVPALRLRVSNSVNAKREQFQLHWEGVAKAPTVDIYVPPGQNRVVQAPKLPPGVTGEHLVLSGDDDDFDNSVYVIQPDAEQITVLYLGDEKETDTKEPLYYLKHAFQQTRRQAVTIRAQETTAPLGPADLGGVRLVIAAGELPPDQASTLREFVEAGGTALLVVKDQKAARSLGPLTGAAVPAATDVTPPNYAMLGQLDFAHPLFAPFADPRFSDFTKIHFWKYRRLDAGQLSGAHILARFDSGDPALIEMPHGRGRLLVLTSGWQPADSQLALSSKFVPLLYSMLELAGGIRGQITQVRIGEPVDLAGAVPSAAGQALKVRKPDGVEVQLPPGVTVFAETDVPGIYSVTTAQPAVRFAVNLEASESRTAPLPVDELERLGLPLKPHEIELTKQVEQKRRLHEAELENRQKLWRWLTFAALMVLLIETWVSGRLTRRAAVTVDGAL